MNRWTRTAAATALMAGWLSGIGCAGFGGEKSAEADPVARGVAPDGSCPTGGCSTCPGGGCGEGTDRVGATHRLNNLYDPCWPSRYAYVARQEVLAPFAMQVNNAEIIEQTVWNYHFKPDTDELNNAGLEKLDYLTRRRPYPNAKVYLQTARDISYDAAKPDKFVNDRLALDEKRAQAVRRYLAAQTASRPVNFEVTVTDPVDPGMTSVGPANAVRTLYSRQYQSAITGMSGGQQGGAGGGGGGGGGQGGMVAPGGGGAPAAGAR